MKNLFSNIHELCQFVLTESIFILSLKFHIPVFQKKNLPQILGIFLLPGRNSPFLISYEEFSYAPIYGSICALSPLNGVRWTT